MIKKMKIILQVIVLCVTVCCANPLSYAENIEDIPLEQAKSPAPTEKNEDVVTPALASTLADTQAESTPLYQLIGIEEGDVIVLNEKSVKTVAVIDNHTNTHSILVGNGSFTGNTSATTAIHAPDATATNINKVVFTLNEAVISEVTQAPYKAELTAAEFGENTLRVEIHDTQGQITTINRTFTAYYGAVECEWSENFEGENPAILNNFVDANPDAVPDTSLNYADTWSKEITSFKGSTALELYTGGAYVGSSVVIGLMPEGLELTNNINRVFLEFDYGGTGYGRMQMKDILISNAWSAKKGSGVYANVKLPTSLLGLSSSDAFVNKIGLDISWDNENNTIDVIFLIDGLECFRQSGKVQYNNGVVDPTKFYVQLSNSELTKCTFWLDNLRMTAYNAFDASDAITEAPVITAFDDEGNGVNVLNDISADVNYMTVDLTGGTDSKTLEGNVSLIDKLTGESIELAFDDNKILLKEQLKAGSAYTFKVGLGVKNMEGNHLLIEQNINFTPEANRMTADRAQTGFGESVLPAIGSGGTVTFNAKIKGASISGKTVTVVCAVYDGNLMVAHNISPQTVPADGVLTPVTVTISEMKDNTVVEAFIVDNLVTKTPVTTEIYSLK